MDMMERRFAVLALVMITAFGNPAASAPASAEAENSRKYDGCMALVRDKPEQAHRMATTWGSEGGGLAARHCAAAAMIGMGLPAEAAQRLEDLAGDLARDMAQKKEPKQTRMRGNLLAQAANAWMIAGRPNAAHALQTKALKLRPLDVELLIDRAISLAALKKYWPAIDDLNRALDLDPRRVAALVFRASAYRRLKQPALATDDIERALEIDPSHPAGLLESGNIRMEANDKHGARRDWMKIIKTAPWSPSAETARRNLEKIDVKTK